MQKSLDRVLLSAIYCVYELKCEKIVCSFHINDNNKNVHIFYRSFRSQRHALI